MAITQSQVSSPPAVSGEPAIDRRRFPSCAAEPRSPIRLVAVNYFAGELLGGWMPSWRFRRLSGSEGYVEMLSILGMMKHLARLVVLAVIDQVGRLMNISQSLLQRHNCSGADILRTAVAPTWTEIGQLGAIVVLRTALNFFLQQEIDKAEARRLGPSVPSLRDAPPPS